LATLVINNNHKRLPFPSKYMILQFVTCIEQYAHYDVVWYTMVMVVYG